MVVDGQGRIAVEGERVAVVPPADDLVLHFGQRLAEGRAVADDLAVEIIAHRGVHALGLGRRPLAGVEPRDLPRRDRGDAAVAQHGVADVVAVGRIAAGAARHENRGRAGIVDQRALVGIVDIAAGIDHRAARPAVRPPEHRAEIVGHPVPGGGVGQQFFVGGEHGVVVRVHGALLVERVGVITLRGEDVVFRVVPEPAAVGVEVAEALRQQAGLAPVDVRFQLVVDDLADDAAQDAAPVGVAGVDRDAADVDFGNEIHAAGQFHVVGFIAVEAVAVDVPVARQVGIEAIHRVDVGLVVEFLHRQLVGRGIRVADQQDVLDAHGNIVVLEPLPHPVGLAVRRLSGDLVPAVGGRLAVDRGFRDRVHDIAQRALVRNEAVEIGRIGIDGVRGHDEQHVARRTGFTGGNRRRVPRSGCLRVGDQLQRLVIQHGVGREAVRAAHGLACKRNREHHVRNLPEGALHGIVEGRMERHAHELPAAHLRNTVQDHGRAGCEGVGAVDVHVFSSHDVLRPAIERRDIGGRPPRRGGTNQLIQGKVRGLQVIDGDGNGSQIGIRWQGVGGHLLRETRLAGIGGQRGVLATGHVHEAIRRGNRERRQVLRDLEGVCPSPGCQETGQNSAKEFCKQVSCAHRLPPGLIGIGKTFNLFNEFRSITCCILMYNSRIYRPLSRKCPRH